MTIRLTSSSGANLEVRRLVESYEVRRLNDPLAASDDFLESGPHSEWVPCAADELAATLVQYGDVGMAPDRGRSEGHTLAQTVFAQLRHEDAHAQAPDVEDVAAAVYHAGAGTDGGVPADAVLETLGYPREEAEAGLRAASQEGLLREGEDPRVGQVLLVLTPRGFAVATGEPPAD